MLVGSTYVAIQVAERWSMGDSSCVHILVVTALRRTVCIITRFICLINLFRIYYEYKL